MRERLPPVATKNNVSTCDTDTIRFRNGAVLSQVPLRDLVDNAGYWNS